MPTASPAIPILHLHRTSAAPPPHLHRHLHRHLRRHLRCHLRCTSASPPLPLAAQAKTFNEFIERTFESVRQNVAFLFKILGAFMRIIFCLRGKKRTHVDAVAQEFHTGLNAAAALPPSGKKKLVAKVAAKFSKLFGGGGEEGGEGGGKGGGKGGDGGGKKGKPVKQAPLSRAAAAAAEAETGDDLVEAYIKFAKEAAAAEAHADEVPSPRPAQLAKPGLRPGLMGPAGGGGGSSASNNR